MIATIIGKVKEMFTYRKMGNEKSIMILTASAFVFGVVIASMIVLKCFPTTIKSAYGEVVVKPSLSEEELLVSDFLKQKNRRLPKTLREDIAVEIIKQSKERGLPYEIVLGIIHPDSNYDPSAVSCKGAKGLMQVMEGWPTVPIDEERVFDIDYNIKIGIDIFFLHLKKSKGDLIGAFDDYSGNADNHVWKVEKAMGEFLLFKNSRILSITKNEKSESDVG